MWDDLKNRIQDEVIKSFSDIQTDWLNLMWTLDAYRIASVPPIGMGRPADPPGRRIEAIYKGKGNYFAEVLALLLQNRTEQQIRPRPRVQGFSQPHQIDLAWPSRDVDPLVCVETKVTGGPPYGRTPSRGAIQDFTNRRKELKFAATDLKLWRRQQNTVINHWGYWRSKAPPTTYFLWGARLKRTGRPANDDNIEKLIREAKALVDTYLDGAGIFAWEERGGAYHPVPLPVHAGVMVLDDVLHRIESEIKDKMPEGQVPPPERPPQPVVEVTRLADDPEEPS
jgi:hypothetical protein